MEQWVLEAQRSTYAADALIERYLPFIKAETAKFLKRTPEDHDDELSIAMLAFYEAAMGYKTGRGAFVRLAAAAIRNRLIDHHRQERRHKGLISYHAPLQDREEPILDLVADEKDHADELVLREAARAEITEYAQQLLDFDLSLTDIADNCPKQSRTLRVCMEAVQYVKQQPELLQQLLRSKKLPLNQICQQTGADRKTLERHRKYLVAALLAYTNGFEIIRSHIHQLHPGKEGA